MGKITSFEDLLIWQKAIELSVEIYSVTTKFPKEEIFGLTSQIRRASNSVSLNIAEGFVKSTNTFLNHLSIAKGSATEVLSGSILATKLNFINEQDLSKIRHLVNEQNKMINGLITSIKNNNNLK